MTREDSDRLVADVRELLPLIRALCVEDGLDENRLDKCYTKLYRVASQLPTANGLGSELDDAVNVMEDDLDSPKLEPGTAGAKLKLLESRAAALVRRFRKLTGPKKSGPPPGPLTWEQAAGYAGRVRALFPLLLSLRDAWGDDDDDFDHDRYAALGRSLFVIGSRLTAYDPELAHEIESCDPFADDAEGGPLPPGGADEVFTRLEAEVNPMLNELRRVFDA
ncbi:hypothetical protein GobsT_57180 [Gemmata obscuriglobus]|uniref:Uncharacterized protein n=1 Tax=Gemmata obscuriglobus TaxID=114 RepID=A0A2Z3H030_9BACT|nr:hypothetical protein [Gemmata obscuriglobus]AWM36475.1 hypothetical protein C1280_05195 [Gemmata obscuriglobus]QEG30900.1 hypothetical protein GobsT_57180 [Gemmata obscuriglobus]VTS10233.1 unnamed protein product [Gemmata obscuriglobus UQM 2246]